MATTSTDASWLWLFHYIKLDIMFLLVVVALLYLNFFLFARSSDAHHDEVLPENLHLVTNISQVVHDDHTDHHAGDHHFDHHECVELCWAPCYAVSFSLSQTHLIVLILPLIASYGYCLLGCLKFN